MNVRAAATKWTAPAAPSGPPNLAIQESPRMNPSCSLAELVTTRSYYLSASPTERNQIDADVAAFLRIPVPGRRHGSPALPVVAGRL
jgi:hypothetical protein